MKLFKNILYSLLIIITIIVALTSQPGTKFIIYCGLKFIPGHIQVQKITGSIWEQNLRLDNIEYKLNDNLIKIRNIHFTWLYQYTNTLNIIIPNFKINNIIFNNNDYISLAGVAQLARHNYTLNIYSINGVINNTKLIGNLNLTYQAKAFIIHSAYLKLGVTTLNIQNNAYKFNLQLNNIYYKDQYIKSLFINLSGDSLKSTGTIDLNSQNFTFATNIQATYSDLTNIFNKNLTVKFIFTDSKLILKYTANKGIIKLDPSILELTSTDHKLISKLAINFSPVNTISAVAEIANHAIKANITSFFTDLSILENIFTDDLSQVRGSFNSNLEISGTRDNLQIQTNTEFNNVKLNLINLGIELNPFNLRIFNKNSQEIAISGSGRTSGSSNNFFINGTFNYINLQSFKLSLTGNNIKVVNNTEYNISISPSLLVTLNHKPKIELSGNIFINSAIIDLREDDLNQPVISSEVIFVEKHPDISPDQKLNTSSAYDLVPNLHLRMRENVHFSGFGIEAALTGNLHITKKHQNYLGDGRITIKKGSYKLPGKLLAIKMGRLIYNPGTLLSDPSLDIKLSNKKELEDNFNMDKEEILYVQGTLHNPILVNSGLLTSSSATSQIFNTGSGKLTEKLQEKLGLDELGLASNAQNSTTEDSILEQQQFVVGKKLSKRFYLQYLKDIVDTNNTVRLKFKLLKNLSVGVESDNYGNGADLYFFKEYD